jgi:hypothetical protein
MRSYEMREDIYQDDLDKLIRTAVEFIDLMQSVKGQIDDASFKEHAVALEQDFRDMLYPTYLDLCERTNNHVALPKSRQLQEDENKHSHNKLSDICDAYIQSLNNDTALQIARENIEASKAEGV